MHNAYFSSTTVSFRSKGSLSYFNDYSNLFDERFDRTPLSCCSCCCTCCEFSAARSSRVPLNTSFLNGLRQSTLLQCSPYKRLTFGGNDRIFSRFPIHDLDGGSYEVSCSIRKRNGNEGFRRGRKERFRCMVSEEKSERSWLGRFDEAETVISLLSEKVSEEYLGGRERDERRRRKRLEVLKNEDHGGEVSRGRKKKVEVEKWGNYGGESSSRRKKNIGSNMLQCDSKCGIESTRIESREESNGRNERRETIGEGDNHRERTKSSSCSSYYSLPSAGEYGSDDEAQDKEELVKESLGGFRKDLSRSEEVRYKARVAKELIEVDQRDAIVEGSSVAGSRVEWDCRKKSEKKLAEVAAEGIKARKQSSQSQWKTDRISKTDSEKASTSHTQFNDVDEDSALLVNLNKGTGKIYSEMDVQDTKQPRSKWQEVTEKEYMRGSDVEATSESQKQFSCREDSMYRGGSHQTVCLTAANSDLRNPQQPRTSEILNMDTEEVSNLHRYSDPGMKVRKKDETTLAQSSVQRTKGQQQQRSERISGQINLRREPDCFPETSETRDTNPTTISTVQSETRIKNLEENSRLQHCKEDHEHHQRIQSRKESQNVTRVSVIQASEMDRHSKSLRTSEKRVNQEITVTSPLKQMGKTSLEWKQPGERVVQSKFRQEAEKPTRVSSSHDESLEESSSVQASLNLVSQAREQQTCAEEEEEEFLQPIMMPPAPQLLARSSQHAVTTSDFAIQEVSSESGSSGLHKHSGMRTPSLHGDSCITVGQDEACDEPLNLSTHEDALGSAHRLEESSTQFVREFVEKAKHEASTSQIQKEDIAGRQYKKSSGQYGSEGLKLKARESGRSSDGSGAKRHSGELWDVSASFDQPQEEAQEGKQAAGNAIVKRRGRSLWNIMADIVRLRWASHAETPISAPRSDEKSPSKISVSSETWFSGLESDKNGDENMKRERSTMLQDATSFPQLQQGLTSFGSQGEISDKMKSKSEEKKRETDMPSSNLTEHGSTSKRISPVTSDTTDKNPDQKTDWTSSQSTSSSQEALSSSSQLPAGSSRSPSAVEANSENSKTYLSESGALVELAKPFNSSFIEVSQSSGKDGDLKQRKLHRNKQVLKDRFDEWEEAYKLESEQRRIDEMFMREALLEAKKAADTWEVPVGAVLVHHGKIIARGCNLVEELRDSTAHAEMICIREASNVLRTWRLADTTLYVTLEPCPMCAGAILQARVSNLVWGAPNKLLGADGSWVRLFPDGGEKRDCSEPSDMPPAPVHPFHTKMTIRRGVLAGECADIMQQFFQLRRRKKAKNEDPSPPPSCLPIANQQTKFLAKMQHMFHLMFCL